jgi:basic membrane lipoprotein Med (substrate-binding protein (PBP1-ABC) superfamily)
MPRSKLVRVTVALLATVAAAGIVAATAGGGTAQTQLQVALLTPGTQKDGSWGQAWSTGAKQAAARFGVKLTIVGNLNTPDQYLAQGAAFGSKEFDLVIMANGILFDATQKLAKQFPNTYWCMSPVDFLDRPGRTRKFAPNSCVVDPEQQDGAFRAGVLAGLITKTNVIASVNGFAFPALTRQPEAFALGARCVNSKVKFEQKYINSWDDVALAKAATQAFIGDQADVIFAATNQAVQGMYEAAKSAPQPTYVIPSYFDAHNQAPDVVLTSVLYNLQGVAFDLIKRLKQESLPRPFFKSYSFANLGVGRLAPFYNLASAVPASAKRQLAEVDAAIKSGKIRVPDETRGVNGKGLNAIGTTGAAAKINVRSIGCEPVR